MSGSSKQVLCEGLSRSARKRVESLGTPLAIADGRTVVAQGALDRCFYIVSGGTAIAQRNGEHAHLLGPGDWFGGPGAILDERSPESVVAFSGLQILVYDAREVLSLMEAAPVFEKRVLCSMLRAACDLVVADDGDRRTDVLDPSERAERPQALHHSLA